MSENKEEITNEEEVAEGHMTLEKWNGWVNPILSWKDNEEEVLTLFNEANADMEEEDLEEEVEQFERDIATIASFIKRGTRENRADMRKDLKKKIQDAGSQYPLWPHKGRGRSSSLSAVEQECQNQLLTIEGLAQEAYYNTYVEHSAEHLLVKRASTAKKTNGTAYPSMAEWRDAKVSSKKQIVTNLITKKLWGSYDEEGQFVGLTFESPVVIPFTPKGE